MSAASDLTRESWQHVSRLLDEALELPADRRAAWLHALPSEHASIRPALQALLERAAKIETGEWLLTLPKQDRAIELMSGAGAAGAVPGALVGPYRLLREIGLGGMGAVWLAERADGTLKRQIALKLPRAAWSSDLAQRMARERDMLAALEHPNIARLYDAGVDERGRPYLALEYVEGEPIDVWCTKRGATLRHRLELLLQVARAVTHAHARLIIHRDLKPSNILVTAAGEVRLLDFGIGKLLESGQADKTQLTRAGGRALTPDYASPEQISGVAISTASDVYSLGVVMFELLTANKPYKLKRGSAAELEEAIVAADAPPASTVAPLPFKRALRGDLDAIIATALRKDPAQRYPTVDALGADIERYLRQEPVRARADSRWYRLKKFVMRNLVPVAAATAVSVAVIAGAGVALWQAREAVEQARIAREQTDVARKESRRAQAVQDFLIGIFRRNTHLQEDPAKARATTARELLDIGTSQVGDALKDVPEAQLQVISMLTDMYTQLSLRGEAEQLRRRGLEVARKTFAPDDVRLADAVLSYSQTLQMGERRAEIPPLLAEARGILDRAGETTTYLRGALLYETARFQRDESLPAALVSADEQVAFFRAHHPKRGTLINGLRLATRARLFAFKPAEAEATALQAVELARQREGGAAAAWLVGALADLSETQWLQLKTSEAEQSIRESVAMTLRVNGEHHGETLLSSMKLAALLIRSGRHAEGEQLAQSVLTRIDQPKTRYSAGTIVNIRGILALARYELGLPAEADAATAADVDDLRATFPNSGALANRLLTLAEIRAMRGRDEEAEALLKEGEMRWRRFAGSMAGEALDQHLALSRARIANARGDAASALEHLKRIPLLTPNPAVERAVLLGDVERSEAAQRAGRHDEALAAAQRALDAIRGRSLSGLAALEPRALVALGRAQLAVGNRAEALRSLQDAVGLHLKHGDPASLWLADAKIALGTAIARSDPARSRQLLSDAKIIHSHNRDVGAQWRVPAPPDAGAAPVLSATRQ